MKELKDVEGMGNMKLIDDTGNADDMQDTEDKDLFLSFSVSFSLSISSSISLPWPCLSVWSRKCNTFACESTRWGMKQMWNNTSALLVRVTWWCVDKVGHKGLRQRGGHGGFQRTHGKWSNGEQGIKGGLGGHNGQGEDRIHIDHPLEVQNIEGLDNIK